MERDTLHERRAGQGVRSRRRGDREAAGQAQGRLASRAGEGEAAWPRAAPHWSSTSTARWSTASTSTCWPGSEALLRDRYRPLGLAHPPPDRHERRAVRAAPAARDRPRRSTRSRSSRLQQAPCRGLRRAGRDGPAAARRARAARDADRARRAVGDRHQRPDADGAARRSHARRRRTACRSSPATGARTPSPTPTCSWPRPTGWASDRRTSIVVGDSVWDLLAARRARALGIGLLSGGYGSEELRARRRLPGLRRPGRSARATSTRSACAATERAVP